jgi:hypothetical protein
MDDRDLIQMLRQIAQTLAHYNVELRAHRTLVRDELQPALREALGDVIKYAIVLLPSTPSGSPHTCPNCGHSLTVIVNVT